jgi:hypothetical protein
MKPLGESPSPLIFHFSAKVPITGVGREAANYLDRATQQCRFPQLEPRSPDAQLNDPTQFH